MFYHQAKASHASILLVLRNHPGSPHQGIAQGSCWRPRVGLEPFTQINVGNRHLVSSVAEGHSRTSAVDTIHGVQKWLIRTPSVQGSGLFREDSPNGSLLFIGEVVGEVHHVRDVKVPELVAMFVDGHPFTFDAHFLSGFHDGCRLEPYLVSIQVLYGLIETHQRFFECDVCGVLEIVSFPFEERMLLRSDHESQPARVSIYHVFSLFEEEDVLSICHTWEHFYGEAVLFTYRDDVGTLFALFGGVLLVHPWSHLSGDHFLFAVALSGSFSCLVDVFVSIDLHRFSEVQVF